MLDLMLSRTSRMLILGDWIQDFRMLYLMVKICSLSSMLREKVNIPKKGYYASRVAAFYNLYI